MGIVDVDTRADPLDGTDRPELPSPEMIHEFILAAAKDSAAS